MQARKFAVDGLPDNFEIDLEVPVCEGIAHLVGRDKRQLRVRSHEFREALFDVVAGLSNDFEMRITASWTS